MIDFVPLENYSNYYYYFLLILVLFIWFFANSIEITNITYQKKLQLLGFIIVVIITLYMGLRPISGRYFGDTQQYFLQFERYKNNIFNVKDKKEFAFDNLMIFSSKYFEVHTFLLLCAILYILPLYFACKKIFNQFWFYPFMMLVVSFSFWSAGTNGVRSAIASSFIILSISRKNIYYQLFFIVIAIGFHQSIIIPAVAYLLTLKFNNTKYFFIFWLICIPISLITTNFFQTFFASLFNFDKLNEYLLYDDAAKEFSRNGFRWDFLLYSSTGVFSGLFFIYKKKYSDFLYKRIFNIYLFSNGIWILVIRAQFSNRFAYLSWFMLGLVISYPFLKKVYFKEQHRILVNILFIYFLFTFFMEVH